MCEQEWYKQDNKHIASKIIEHQVSIAFILVYEQS